ncbi:YceI family protein [Flagellimonas sp. S174]|uniref:YceI family protein n=1 Tax=Flagellimonas sp. S174 TaxID=3410790 RepID=UPI003BF51EE6
MKMLTSLVLIALVFFKTNLHGQSTGKITSAKITFEFVSKEVKGTIEGFESQSKIDWQNLENSYFKGAVQSKTLDTNNGLRNWSLRSGKYFNVDDYPKITFESKRIRNENTKLLVTGNLNIKGVEKEITITFTKNGQQLVGTTSLYSIDYGIKIKKRREDNLVKVKMVFETGS